MGGSGGGSFSEYSDLTKEIQKALSGIENTELEKSIAELISNQLAYSNNRDSDAIKKHIQEIIKGLEKEIEGSIDSLFGGSVAKHTFVNGLSDVDTLLIINDSDLVNKTPNEVKAFIEKRLKERFPNTEITVGKLAVTIGFADYEIQLIPAIKKGDLVKIPTPKGDAWSDKIDPKAFVRQLTDINSRLNNKVVPVIKLAKSIIYSYAEQKQLSGYHIEALAVQIFNGYNGKITTSEMLKTFFSQAQELVLSPLKDPTGQSKHIDSDLKGENSLERQLVADALRYTSRKMKNATTIEQWEQLFE